MIKKEESAPLCLMLLRYKSNLLPFCYQMTFGTTVQQYCLTSWSGSKEVLLVLAGKLVRKVFLTPAE